MSNWYKLPNEILRLTLLQLESNKKDVHQCLFVNKQCLLIGQSILYKHIYIQKLQQDNNLINTLLHSSCEPGLHVKRISFQEEIVPPVENLAHLESRTDLLHLLIDKCPYVETIDFSSSFTFQNQRSVEYLIMTIKGNKKWKLRVIPDPNGPVYNINKYNRLARMMETSLQHIVIEIYKNDAGYYGYLKIYPKLSSVKIKYYGSANMSDCIKVMKNVPLLDNLQVDFDMKEAANSNLDDNKFDVEAFIYLKKLQLTNFKPSSDKELLFFIQKFTKVINFTLSIPRYRAEEQLRLTVVIKFLKYIRMIPNYNIDIDLYHKFNFLKDCFDVFGYDTLTFRSISSRIDTCSAKFSDNTELIVALANSFSYHELANYHDMQQALNIIGDYPQHINFCFLPRSGTDSETYDVVNDYLDLVITFCHHIHRLEFSKGVLNPDPLQVTSSSFSVSHLVLRELKLCPSSLSCLSLSFPYLESLRLEACEFIDSSQINSGGEVGRISRISKLNSGENQDQDIRMDDQPTSNYFKIGMNLTEFKSIEVVSLYPFNATSKIFVHTTLLKNTKLQVYYMIDGDGNNAVKVNQNEYEAATRSITNDMEMITICLKVLSIESFKFSAPCGLHFTLEFV